MAGKQKLNEAEKNAFHEETIKKEKRQEILQTEFTFNPNRRRKCSSSDNDPYAQSAQIVEDLQKAHLVPTMEYSMPQTSSQEIGWWVANPLIPLKSNDKTFHRRNTDVTK
ncbi:cilia- and flagella-associated protein 144 [Spinachia spinachia]